MDAAYYSDVGRLREKDEDSIIVLKIGTCYSQRKSERMLLVLGDGVGGGPSGEVASFLATKMLSEYLLPELLASAQGIDYLPSLREGVREVNRRIMDYCIRNPQHQGMATTLLAAVIEDYTLMACNVGDSRLYVITEKEMKKITVDHTDAGGLLTQAVGLPYVEADLFKINLTKGNKVLLCCDGLTDMLSEKKIHSIIKEKRGLNSACLSLIKEANEAGGADNISVILAEVS